MRFGRTDTSLFGRWWWTVDRVTLICFVVLIALGAILVTAASPAIAKRISVDPFYFINRQYFFLLLSIPVMIGASMLSPRGVRRAAVIGFLISIGLMMLVPVFGPEVKGARRWLAIGGMSIQPSEFLKPCFAVTVAWVLSERFRESVFPAYRVAIAVYALVAVLLVLQPDIGMLVTVSAVWAALLFLAGVPLVFCGALVLGGIGGLYLAYLKFPHVTKRIDNFLNPDGGGDTYQVEKALAAFQNGGFFGVGPGEGTIKRYIPDAHTDYIFAVMGEEFGVVACILLLVLFAAIVLRGLSRVWREQDAFVTLATAGLLTQFGMQALINMGVAVNLLPAKGMTLPFISYGGSSVLAIAFGMGMVLALTRKRYGAHYASTLQNVYV